VAQLQSRPEHKSMPTSVSPPSPSLPHHPLFPPCPETYPADAKVCQLGSPLIVQQDVLRGHRLWAWVVGRRVAEIGQGNRLRPWVVGRRVGHGRRLQQDPQATVSTHCRIQTSPARQPTACPTLSHACPYFPSTHTYLWLEVTVHHRGVQVGQARRHVMCELQGGRRVGRQGWNTRHSQDESSGGRE